MRSADGIIEHGKRFLLIDASVENGRARLLDTARHYDSSVCAGGTYAGRSLKMFTLAGAVSIWRNRSLLRSMVRRDIMARYRGSFGDVLWTVLNPLLLMVTYFFVFGIVLESRFGPDKSRTGFALYFLAGMLPWLAFTEAAGRAPHVDDRAPERSSRSSSSRWRFFRLHRRSPASGDTGVRARDIPDRAVHHSR